MFIVKENVSNELKKIRTKCYAEEIGVTPNYMSALLNGSQKCTKLNAKAILSICFNISLINERMEELLDKYFEEEGNYGGGNQ